MYSKISRDPTQTDRAWPRCAIPGRKVGSRPTLPDDKLSRRVAEDDVRGRTAGSVGAIIVVNASLLGYRIGFSRGKLSSLSCSSVRDLLSEARGDGAVAETRCENKKDIAETTRCLFSVHLFASVLYFGKFVLCARCKSSYYFIVRI